LEGAGVVARKAGRHARGWAGAGRDGAAPSVAAFVCGRSRRAASGRSGRRAAARRAVSGRLSVATIVSWDPVTPDLRAPLRGLRIAARRRSALRVGGQHRSRDNGAGLEFFQYRGYEPGDELRRIDLKLYVRSDRLIVREAERD